MAHQVRLRKIMKFLKLTYLIFTVSLAPAIFAQDEKADSSTEVNSKVDNNSKANTEVESKAVNKTEDKSGTEENSKSENKSEAQGAKPMFGSKEHRSLVEEAPSKIESTENVLFKTCIALAAVIAVILLIFSVLKKINGRLNNTGLENPLRVKNKLMIDSKNYLALVRVYEEELLVSVGPNGTNLLTRYALVDKEDAEGTDFENVLNSEGRAVVPADLENHTKGVDIKSIRELKNNAPS